MKVETEKSKVGEAFGQVINKEFDFSWKVYETREEMESEWSEKDLLEVTSAQNKANAKSKAYQAIIQPYKPDPKHPYTMYLAQIQTFVKMGVPEEVARQQVNAILQTAGKEIPTPPKPQAETVAA